MDAIKSYFDTKRNHFKVVHEKIIKFYIAVLSAVVV